MKLPAGISKWGVAVLGVVCLLLVANLVAQYRHFQPERSRSTASPASASAKTGEKATAHATEGLAQYDPTVHFEVLKAVDSRPLPEEDRNPFEFVGGEPLPVPSQQGAKPNLPPPPPPPPPLKAAGYNELPGGAKEAMISYNDDIVVVHEGDVIGGKFKVVKITPAMVEVVESDTNKSLDLPFPQ